MKKIIRYSLVSLLIAVIAIVGTVVFAYSGANEAFKDSYQRVLRTKYDYMLSIDEDEPRIIIMGGSSLAFGLREDLMEEATGYKIVNLGVKADIGPEYMCELVKQNVREGDIVLFANEYETFPDYKKFEGLDGDVWLSAVGDRWDMYKYLKPKQWLMVLGSMYDFIEFKGIFAAEDNVYNIDAYDPVTGYMTYDREKGWFKTCPIRNYVDIDQLTISDETVDYLKQYKLDLEAKGASFYMVPPPVCVHAVRVDYSLFGEWVDDIEERTGVDYLGDPIDYFFDYDLIYDTYYHCSNAGAMKRTELLVQSLKDAGIIEE